MLDTFTGASTYVGGTLWAIGDALMAGDCTAYVMDHICADMTRYSIVGLKSMNHFRGFYTSHSDAIVTADTPGMRPSNLRLTPYRHVLYLSAG